MANDRGKNSSNPYIDYKDTCKTKDFYADITGHYNKLVFEKFKNPQLSFNGKAKEYKIEPIILSDGRVIVPVDTPEERYKQLDELTLLDYYALLEPSELDDKRYARCLQLLEKDIYKDLILNVAKFNDKHYKRFLELDNKGFHDFWASTVAKVEDEKYKKCLDLLDKNTDQIEIYNYASLTDKQYRRYISLKEKDIQLAAAKDIAELDEKEYQKVANLMDKNIAPEIANEIFRYDEEEYELFCKLADAGVVIEAPMAIRNLGFRRQPQLMKLIEEFKDIGVKEHNGEVRFFNCTELAEAIRYGYYHSRLGEIKNKGIVEAAEINKIIATARSMNKYSSEKGFIDYCESIDYESLTSVAPSVKKYTIDDFNRFLNLHFKNNTKEFTKDSLTYDGDFGQLLATDLMKADELSRFLYTFPNTNKKIGSLPSDWVNNPSEDLVEKVYEAIDNFIFLIGSKEINSLEFENEIASLGYDLSKALEKKVNASYLKSGGLGDVIKIEVEGADAVVLKKYKELHSELDSCLQRYHGICNEPQAGFFAREHELTNFAEFYFGRVANYDDSDGFMVTKFISHSDNPPDTTTDKLGFNYIVSIDDDLSNGNRIAGKFVDYGSVKKVNNNINIEQYKLLRTIINDTMDFERKLILSESVDFEEYLNQLSKTSEVKESEILYVLNLLVETFGYKVSLDLKAQIEEWCNFVVSR